MHKKMEKQVALPRKYRGDGDSHDDEMRRREDWQWDWDSRRAMEIETFEEAKKRYHSRMHQLDMEKQMMEDMWRDRDARRPGRK